MEYQKPFNESCHVDGWAASLAKPPLRNKIKIEPARNECRRALATYL
jgi:hypothetical protein